MSKESYNPLSHISSKTITSRLTLPFHLEERIGLNVKKAQTVAKIGGIGYLHLANDSEAQKTKVEGSVIGINSDGSAVAGATKVDYAPVSEIDKYQDEEKFHSSRWLSVHLKINSEEIKSRLLGQDKVVTKPAVWATELNQVVTKELRSAGNKHLLGLIRRDYFSTIILHGAMLNFTIANLLGKTPSVGLVLGSFLGEYARIGSVFFFVNSLIDGPERDGHGTRFTLGIGPEIDRTILFNLALLGKPLIAPIVQT